MAFMIRETGDPLIGIRTCPKCATEWLEWGSSSFMTCIRCRERERWATVLGMMERVTAAHPCNMEHCSCREIRAKIDAATKD